MARTGSCPRLDQGFGHCLIGRLMDNKIGRQQVNSFLDTLKQLGPARLGVMGAITLMLLVFFIFVSMRVATPEMKLLYSDLSSMDSGAMAAKLEEAQIPYQVSQDGTRVMVGDDNIGRARMLLAEAGLPNGGSMGYEIFDNQSGFGTTNAIQNINQVRALEGELARTISSLEPVRSARVHLVLPQRELFSRENRAATASVMVGLRPGAKMTEQQVSAVQSLISSAVPQLKMSDVSIIDQNGNLLARGGGESDLSVANMKAEEMRLGYERRVTQSVEDLVGRTVGYGKVRATVTADINFDRISTNEETYNPEGQVARSTQTVEESSQENAGADGGETSVEGNLPGANPDLLGIGGPTAQGNRVEETTNYEISKTVRNLVRETGEVRKLSVAVLVDGRYTEAEDGAKTYAPRSAEEIAQIEALVKSAIGFDEKRGDTLQVVNMQFAEVDTVDEGVLETTLMGFDKNKLLDAVEVITVAIMIILVVLLVLQPMIGRLLASENAPSSGRDENAGNEMDLLSPRTIAAALEGPGSYDGGGSRVAEDSLIDMQKVEGKVKASSIKKVEDIVEAYPQETVSVIRSWMTQD